MMSLYMTKLISILIYVIYTLISSESHPREKKLKKKKRGQQQNDRLRTSDFGHIWLCQKSYGVKNDRAIDRAMAAPVRQKVL